MQTNSQLQILLLEIKVSSVASENFKAIFWMFRPLHGASMGFSYLLAQKLSKCRMVAPNWICCIVHNILRAMYRVYRPTRNSAHR